MKAANMMRKILVVLLVLAVASPLAGCGRKSSPQHPDDSEYPRVYPTH